MEVGEETRKAANLTPHRLTAVQEVHETQRYFGKGIRIGIIDSGVDYTVIISRVSCPMYWRGFANNQLIDHQQPGCTENSIQL